MKKGGIFWFFTLGKNMMMMMIGNTYLKVCDPVLSLILSLKKQISEKYVKLVNEKTIIFFIILFFNFTILYWFCHISKWIRHRYTCVPHSEPSSLLPPRTIPLSHPSAPAPKIQYHSLNLDCLLISYMILFMFQCHSPKSSYPLPLPQSPQDCSIHQCLFCFLIYRVIVTIFLNPIYMR